MSPDRYAATPGIYLLPFPWIVDVGRTEHVIAQALAGKIKRIEGEFRLAG